MQGKLKLYNTLHRELETFEPLNPPFVGFYLCGPTVYGYPHLGHARGPITFDVLFRYLDHLGYKVRFVRNITDVGHLTNDSDDGDDKIQKRAQIEQLEPMEVAQHYADAYNYDMQLLNVRRPSIEPRASGHIPEQIELIQKIIAAGLAYEVNGSVYFDVPKYAQSHHYGELSGRILEDLVAGAGAEVRKLEGQEEKRHAADFALWKKASPEHIMRWNSPWGEGFPGWHIECTAMSAKYLGTRFDIHGGGMDLMFPHHECEIAQSQAGNNVAPAKYWLHHNMITINGQKMAKSLNNGIRLQDFFNGEHPLLEKAYSPMTLRFFILQAHYRSTIDFSNDALQAAEKGLSRMMTAWNTLQELKPGQESTFSVADLENRCYEALNDDLNTAILIAELFEVVRRINLIKDGKDQLIANDLQLLERVFRVFVFEILGLQTEAKAQDTGAFDHLMHLVIDIRNGAKQGRDFVMADAIRDRLKALGIELKDTKDGTTYEKS